MANTSPNNLCHHSKQFDQTCIKSYIYYIRMFRFELSRNANTEIRSNINKIINTITWDNTQPFTNLDDMVSYLYRAMVQLMVILCGYMFYYSIQRYFKTITVIFQRNFELKVGDVSEFLLLWEMIVGYYNFKRTNGNHKGQYMSCLFVR